MITIWKNCKKTCFIKTSVKCPINLNWLNQYQQLLLLIERKNSPVLYNKNQPRLKNQEPNNLIKLISNVQVHPFILSRKVDSFCQMLKVLVSYLRSDKCQILIKPMSKIIPVRSRQTKMKLINWKRNSVLDSSWKVVVKKRNLIRQKYHLKNKL